MSHIILFLLVAVAIAVPWHFIVGDPVQYLPLRLLFVGAVSLACLWALRKLKLID